MLKNYFTIALNNLIKNKLYSLINIAGLAIGLAACIIIALYVKDQFSYDRQWKDSERIYRINFTGGFPGSEPVTMAAAPVPAMPALKQYYNGKIENGARAFTSSMVVDTGTAKYNEKLVQVDPEFFEIFQLETIVGNIKNTFDSPSNIALSSGVASKYFGKSNPLGKVITMIHFGAKIDYRVTAVYGIKGNSILDIPMLTLFQDTSLPPILRSWNNLNTATYFKLKKGVDIETLKPLTVAFIDHNIDISKIISEPGLKSSDVLQMKFQNIKSIHLGSPWDTSRAGGSMTVVLSFAAIAVLVLLIGCINFTVLTTAKATQRAREVAIRKVVGAKRKQLVTQFLGESVFLTLISIVLSLGLVEIMLPVFETVIGKPLAPDYSSPVTIVSLILLFIVTGTSGGLYPSFILSGFKPGSVLKANQSKETCGSITMRNMLVIFQFIISIIIIIAAIAVYVQLKYSLNHDPGYNHENLLVINKLNLYPGLNNRIELFKSELKKITGVTDVSLSEIQPSQKIKNDRVYTLPGAAESSHLIFASGICYDYFKTYQIPVIAGRNYSEGRDLPEPILGMDFEIGSGSGKKLSERNIIINESASRELGFSRPEDAVGKIINSTTANNSRYTIIGVVSDNHLFSINAMPRAEVYLLQPDQANVITLRFTGSPEAIMQKVNAVWKKVVGDAEISTVFVDQLIAQEFQQERTEQKVLISFSILAIIIACLGLYGSAAFAVERRTKEIGLRKVVGAKIKNIVNLLLWNFSKPVLVANIIAWPLAILAVRYWLERFPYRINLSFLILICIVSGSIALVIALSTVAGNTVRIAKSKPIHSLRYE